MVTPGCEWAVSRVRGVAVLSAGTLPRMQATIKPATITEVLLEVVDCHHADLSRQFVMNFLDDVILGFCYQFLYVSCIHWHYLGIAVKSAISRK